MFAEIDSASTSEARADTAKPTIVAAMASSFQICVTTLSSTRHGPNDRGLGLFPQKLTETPMLTTVFWSLFLFEEAGFLFSAYYLLGPRSGSWGPEGPVGGLLLFVPPILLLVPAAIVL